MRRIQLSQHGQHSAGIFLNPIEQCSTPARCRPQKNNSLVFRTVCVQSPAWSLKWTVKIPQYIPWRIHVNGIFTYITGWFLGQMLVNIPAPWSIWVGNKTIKANTQIITSMQCVFRALRGLDSEPGLSRPGSQTAVTLRFSYHPLRPCEDTASLVPSSPMTDPYVWIYIYMVTFTINKKPAQKSCRINIYHSHTWIRHGN